jgi:hypothetical protein
VTRIVAELVTDLVGIAGAGLIAYGASLIYPPAGWVIAGAFLIAAAVLLSRK